MTRPNYNPTARITELTARIKRVAETLPAGKRNALLNACNYIELHTRKSAEYGAPLPSEESDAIADRYNANRRILAAMLAGRKVSYLDRAEFKTTEWHSRICEVKEMVAKRPEYQHYAFCDRWASDGKHPFKIYWIEDLTKI